MSCPALGYLSQTPMLKQGSEHGFEIIKVFIKSFCIFCSNLALFRFRGSCMLPKSISQKAELD